MAELLTQVLLNNYILDSWGVAQWIFWICSPYGCTAVFEIQLGILLQALHQLVTSPPKTPVRITLT